MGTGIGEWDWRLGLEIGIGDWDRRLGLEIEMGMGDGRWEMGNGKWEVEMVPYPQSQEMTV